MKKILSVTLSLILTLTLAAQTLTISFNGANRNRNYQVIVDGTSYYSNNTTNQPATNNRTTANANDIVLTTLPVGAHNLEVYRIRNNRGTYNNGNNNNTSGNGNALYTKTFQLRQGYDMSITIDGNGQVSFTEKRLRSRNRGNNNQQAILPIADATFSQLLQSIRVKWSQSSKITAVRNAFMNTSYNFSTAQAREMLLLIATEPNRLSLAKTVYPRVTDPANFTQLYDLFPSISSRDDMNAFIRANPNYNNTNNNRRYNDNNDGYNHGNNGGYNNGNNGNGNSNNNNYRTPMADYQFNRLLQSANSQYNQSDRVSMIRDAFSTNNTYFSTAQIRQMLNLINMEGDRLSLAKQAYLHVSDPANFTSVYDLFTNMAYRIDLNNFVQQISNGSGSTPVYNTKMPMADAEFNILLQKAGKHILPWDVTRDVNEAFTNSSNNFNTSQIRQLLGLMLRENDRLAMAKLAWSRTTEQSSFVQLMDMFNVQANKDELAAYIQSHPY